MSMDMPDFDSFSFTSRGVPALTVHTLPALAPNYHTDLDDGREAPGDLVPRLVGFVVRLAGMVLEKRLSPMAVVEEAARRVGDRAPLEALELVHRLRGFVEKYGVAAARAAARMLVRPLAQYRVGGFFKAEVLAEAEAWRQLLSLRRGIMGSLGVIVEPGVERVLPHIPRRVHGSLRDVEASVAAALAEACRGYNDALSSAIAVLEQGGGGRQHI